MCLSSVYQIESDGAKSTEPVLTQVSNAQVDGNMVTFTDIMGVQTALEGTIASVDLIENKIYVQSAA